MFDGTSMYPGGFHPVFMDAIPVGTLDAKYRSRRSVHGVRYYITDFGISTRFQEGESNLVTGSMAQDGDVPELSETVPYDAFAVDVFTLGNLYKSCLLQVRMAIISPLHTC